MVRRIEREVRRGDLDLRPLQLKYGTLLRAHMTQEQIDELWLLHVGSRFLHWKDEVSILQRLREERVLSFEVITSMYYARAKWWRWIRYKALVRDGMQCQVCGATERLQVDHLVYRGFGRERVEDLKTLCIACHKKKTKRFVLEGEGYGKTK